MKRIPTLVRIDLDILEYSRYLGKQLGLNKSEFIRSAVGEKIDRMKKDLDSREIQMVENEIVIAKNNQIIKSNQAAIDMVRSHGFGKNK